MGEGQTEAHLPTSLSFFQSSNLNFCPIMDRRKGSPISRLQSRNPPPPHPPTNQDLGALPRATLPFLLTLHYGVRFSYANLGAVLSEVK